VIAELKQQKELDKLYKQNTIELNDYFAYSGKQEYNNKLVSLIPSYRKTTNVFINNDMSRYVLKDYKKKVKWKNKDQVNS